MINDCLPSPCPSGEGWETAGSTDWVFLRGLVRESAHWDDFPAKFRDTMPGAQTHLIDLPGNGRHWRQTSPLSLNAMMETVRGEALALMQTQKPFFLFSISLGGMIAMEWANCHPAELAGAVLINTSFRGISPLHQRLSWAIWPLMARIAAAGDVAERERLILQLTSAAPVTCPGLIANRVAIHQRHPVQLGNVFRQLLAAARYHPPRTKPPIPILLIHSLGDRMVSPACTQAIAKNWSVKPLAHPWAGHDLPLDAPDWVIKATLEWLKTDTFQPQADKTVAHQSPLIYND